MQLSRRSFRFLRIWPALVSTRDQMKMLPMTYHEPPCSGTPKYSTAPPCHSPRAASSRYSPCHAFQRSSSYDFESDSTTHPCGPGRCSKYEVQNSVCLPFGPTGLARKTTTTGRVLIS